MSKSDIDQIKYFKKWDSDVYFSTKSGVQISASAKALENGSFGQRIKLKNTDSGREIYGYVYDSKTVKNR